MKKLLLLFSFTLAFAWTASAQQPADEADVRGQFTTTKGEPIEGVVVTDGYSVVKTDAEGRYAINRHVEASYVYFSLPAEYEVPLRQGSPCLYKKLTDAKVYDFVLRPMKGGIEKKFVLFGMADPQCQNIQHVYRFRTETVPDLKATARKMGRSCYAVTLGDIAYSQGPRNATYILPIMKNEMAVEKTGVPVFQTIGNHDNEMDAMSLDAHNPTPSIRYQRTFESVFGPVNYSWNRGDVHIISMSDVCYHTLEGSGKYHGDFSDNQVEWLRKDLSFVPKDKLILFCVHVPLIGIRKYDNVKKVLAILGEFPNCHIIAGHTHYNRNVTHKNGIYEHILAAASGCWWWSRNNGDGTPNGYAIFEIEGNKLVDWRYKGVGFDEKHQLRLYRGDAEFGGDYERLKLPFGENILLANVWNYDKNWKVEVYEDGRLAGEMKHTKPSPYRGDEYPSATSSKDWWAIGYNVGVVGRGHFKGSTRRNYCAPCYHMFTYTLKNPSAKIKVVATDGKGRKYTATEVITGADYRTAEPPAYKTCEAW